MLYENNTSEISKCTEQMKYSQAYHIHDGLLYHYTKLDTLWKILESDSLFARNIRFSNDFNEYLTGRNTIEKFVSGLQDTDEPKKKEILKKLRENPMMYFMVCFCEDGDLLSQWRGYAQNGVSIGMDFTGGICKKKRLAQHVEEFCVLNNLKYSEKEIDKTSDKTERKYNIDGNSLVFLQMPYKVQYVSNPENLDEKPDVKQILEKLYDGSEDDSTRLLGYIPYIKDIGFREEEEYRLIYDMELLGDSKAHSDSVRGKKLEFMDSENLKNPYINVEFGKPDKKSSNVKTIWVGGDACEIADKIVKKYADLKIELVDQTGICIGEGINQEEMQEDIEKFIEGSMALQHKDTIKIWCKGHLPIRKIIVGPSEKQNETKESLEYYKRTIYWLKYVDIDVSAIPLRN